MTCDVVTLRLFKIMNRIDKKFSVLKKNKKKAFIAFLTAGYPDFSKTEELVLEFEKNGADIIELGIPFSDPIADGPVIQKASFEALKKGATLKKAFDLVMRLRRKTQIPLAFMSYFNPILSYGLTRFVKDALCSGLDAVIIPDLPPEEEKLFSQEASRCGLARILFIAPTTTLARAEKIVRQAKGFIYFVSLTGTTGQRRQLPPELKGQLQRIKKIARRIPVCAGFGVSSPDQVRFVSSYCDGVIVGSAIVKKISEKCGKPDMVRSTGLFVKQLKGDI